ncbi:MAG: tryptophan synthase subunit alpha [Nitrososphaeria archaeon]|nr:tryptophan synthase subunit alpha [Conexivisphaerales archaeon]
MKKLLVSYITLGYPNENDYLKFVKDADDLGTDIFELGYPPNFAKYDGPLIRRSYLKVKSMYKNFSELISRTRKITRKKIIVLTYLENIQNNLDEFLGTIKSSGADGVLLPDLLIDFPENYFKYLNRISEKGLDTVIFVSPFVPDKIISDVYKFSSPFLYYGVRPTTGIVTPVNISSLLKRLKNLTDSRVVVGFGLKGLEEIKEALSAGADGIAIGSAYVEAFENNGLSSALDVVKRVRCILDDF